MRLSEFRDAAAAAFGEAYAPTLCRELALNALDSLTPEQALAKGVAPRDVWHALCDQMEVSEHVRAGADPRLNLPPRR